MEKFRLLTPFAPKGDQPKAIDHLTRGIEKGLKHQVLLGVTGSGKTFTIANVIEKINRPCNALVPLAHRNSGNFFRKSANFLSITIIINEAYLPTDTYIESIHQRRHRRMRHSRASSLKERYDRCHRYRILRKALIYRICNGHLADIERDEMLRKFTEMLYAV
jgi:excinuclease ABC subunit B